MGLTTRFLDSLDPPTTAPQIAYPDGDVPGLELRVTRKGRKTWTLRYRFRRKPRRLTLGRYPNVPLKTARERARKALVAVDDGRDPATEKQQERRDLTLADFAPDYIAVAKRQKRRFRANRRMRSEPDASNQASSRRTSTRWLRGCPVACGSPHVIGGSRAHQTTRTTDACEVMRRVRG